MRTRSAPKRYSTLRLLVFVIILSPVVFIFYRLSTSSIGSADRISASVESIQLVEDTLSTQKKNYEENIVQRKKIAYAITVTKDGPFVDGALVLGYAAKKVHDKNKGSISNYDADLVAFVAPSVVTSRKILEAYGWRILEREVPVKIDEIINKEYADNMKSSGCCGADEFLKLWSYTLTDYHRVVHLDMDSIIFKNMDALYDIDKEILFTGDYGMIGGSPVPPAQGGFLVIRPSLETFENFKHVIKKGDFGSRGWGGTGIGHFWGGQTIQGIIPYFYYSIKPGESLELNRCEYNCMVDNPYLPDTTICLDHKADCQDCRIQNPENVFSAHFTLCQKPWTCCDHTNPKNAVLCGNFHDRWFALRNEFELENDLDISYREELTKYVNSMGMCTGYGDEKYLPIPIEGSSTG